MDDRVAMVASGFSAMGSEARLDVLRTLVRAGRGGISVGEIGERTGIPASTLAHHLKTLSAAGLIEQVRDGRSIINRAAYARLAELAQFIFEECCADADVGVRGETQKELAS
ncbi:MAG: metalloregulator ArsR/SmtB family transcription factor [Ahrensia sp.]|nr:metalloregulator ArsR/SmtB family transcription factor [Ahrensia sp.]